MSLHPFEAISFDEQIAHDTTCVTEADDTTASSTTGNIRPSSGLGKSRELEAHSDSYGKIREEKEAPDLARELRPLLTILAIIGLYHSPSNPAKSWLGRMLNWRRWYSLLINAAVWSSVISSFMYLLMVDTAEIAPSISLFSYYLKNAICMSYWFYLCAFSPQALPGLMDHLQKELCKLVDQGTSVHSDAVISRRLLRRAVIICLAIPIAAAVFTMSMAAFITSGPIEELRNQMKFILGITGSSAPAVSYIMLCLSLVVQFNADCIFCLLCWIISKQFDSINSIFKKRISATGKLQGDLQDIREQHQRLSKGVLFVDDMFSFYLGLTTAASIFQICFLIYQVIVIGGNSSTGYTVTSGIWLFECAVVFAAVCWFPSKLHEQAHMAVDYVHDISEWENKDGVTSLQMTLFLAKLNGSPIAVTIWRFLPLTRDFLVTIAGVILSYFILVSQTLPT